MSYWRFELAYLIEERDEELERAKRRLARLEKAIKEERKK